MSLIEKINGRRQVLRGWIKQGFGRATGNTRLRAKGRAGRVSGNLKLARERAKDAFKH